MGEDRAASFLQMIRRSQRGRLKIYLGYGPGVGKTYQMLSEAHRLKTDGIDVVVGVVETHGRAETAKLVEGLDVIPRRSMEYRGIVIDEMDVDAILARKPQVVLVDELAHTNAPDSRNPKRYQDVQEILESGTHVISTLNVQHLESLYNTVEKLLGVRVRERIPDSVVTEADQVVNVDLAAEDLQQRLREGKIYPKDRVASALENFFTPSNLEHLRELTLRELASQLDSRRRGVTTAGVAPGGQDQVMVCLSSRGPNSAKLLRYASRLAGRLNRNWYAVYVQTPSEDPTLIDARTQRFLGDNLTLANQLGATVFTFKGQDVADTILRFAAEYRVGNVVIGKPHPLPWWKRIIGKQGVAAELVHRARGLTIIVIDADEEVAVGAEMMAESTPTSKPASATTKGGQTLSGMLTADRVLIWDDPATKADVFRKMASAITGGELTRADQIVARLEERERTGSTFLNEGVALPHARIETLNQPEIALGITRNGVLDAPTEKPTEVIFMLLSPKSGPNVHLQLLAKASRLLQHRELHKRLLKAKTPEEALAELQAAETNGANPPKSAG
ncbi:MAG: PTS sugar transporter subunit IIA [Planctomycetota bacterium]|nr:PTS sugar transporter subunit IIA [Planctomycetota bacterium]